MNLYEAVLALESVKNRTFPESEIKARAEALTAEIDVERLKKDIERVVKNDE